MLLGRFLPKFLFCLSLKKKTSDVTPKMACAGRRGCTWQEALFWSFAEKLQINQVGIYSGNMCHLVQNNLTRF